MESNISISWKKTLLDINSTVGQAIRNLDQSGMKIIMVKNDAGNLEGTVSDGDIRRSLLKGYDLNSPIRDIMRRNPLVVTPELHREHVLRLMIANKIQQIPVVDAGHCVVGLHLWDEVAEKAARSNIMVIMAGGLGSRLRPHTESCPKPLLLVAGKPILEHIIIRAKQEGFSEFILAINYLGHMIEDYFACGQKFGVKIDYLREKSPLGTAGALGLLEIIPDAPFVVTNGDVITDIRYGELIDFHVRNSAAASMAISLREWQNPFGVVQTNGVEIIGFEEKPVIKSYVNAGVYVLNPKVLEFVYPGKNLDMPSLFQSLQSSGQRIVAYPMHEPWLDIGRPNDLYKANNDEELIERGRNL
jgi:dTDP-glucose pyrophosphorylase